MVLDCHSYVISFNSSNLSFSISFYIISPKSSIKTLCKIHRKITYHLPHIVESSSLKTSKKVKHFKPLSLNFYTLSTLTSSTRTFIFIIIGCHRCHLTKIDYLSLVIVITRHPPLSLRTIHFHLVRYFSTSKDSLNLATANGNYVWHFVHLQQPIHSRHINGVGKLF